MGAKLLDVKAAGRQFVDRYELMGEIASGGMATVFLARLTGVGGFQRMYAIKRLHPHLQHEKEFVEMFLDEARLAAGIHHPNVVPILEVGASESAYYLVMEYIEGDTLARLLARAAAKKDRLPVPQVIRIALDTLLGLHAAHELRDESGGLAGVVHRDVSPQNVLVGADGISRITDFGVARAASRLTATRVGQLKGKIAYMAPEQARGDEDIDRRADVFAAGIVFWEALAHRRLFKAQNEAATLSRVLHDPIPSLHEAAPYISKGVCDVIMKALERETGPRLATCAEFADELEKAAIASGEITNNRGVEFFMDEMMGEDIRTHRDAVRAWTNLADSQVGAPPQMTPSGSRSMRGTAADAGDEVTTFAPPKRRKRFVALGLLGLSALGFLGYRFYLSSGDSSAPQMNSDVGPQKDVAPTEVVKAEAPRPSSPVLPLEIEPKTDDSSEPVKGEESSPPKPSTKPNVRPRPRPRPRPSPAPAPKPAPKQKNALDAMDSNPYR